MCEMRRYLWIVVFCCFGFLRNTQSAKLLCYKNSLKDHVTISLDDPTILLNSSCFDSNRPTMCYTFGYNGKVQGPMTTAVLNGFLEENKKNVLLLDWEDDAKITAFGIQMSYFLFAAPNAKLIGRQLGKAFVTLVEAKGLNMTDVHFIGHSLGAHLMGHAGRYTREMGYPVARITGLDPARALYEGGFAIKTGLDRSCGKFVDIAHSNPGDFGSNKSCGTVDVWFNFNDKGLQPGCPEGDFPMFSQEGLCSHNRACLFYIESLFRKTAFQASVAENYESWLQQGNKTSHTIYFGDIINTRASGNYFLSTNDKPPFGKGVAGATADQKAQRYSAIPTSAREYRSIKKYLAAYHMASGSSST